MAGVFRKRDFGCHRFASIAIDFLKLFPENKKRLLHNKNNNKKDGDGI